MWGSGVRWARAPRKIKRAPGGHTCADVRPVGVLECPKSRVVVERTSKWTRAPQSQRPNTERRTEEPPRPNLLETKASHFGRNAGLCRLGSPRTEIEAGAGFIVRRRRLKACNIYSMTKRGPYLVGKVGSPRAEARFSKVRISAQK